MFNLISNTKQYFARRSYQTKLPEQLRSLYGENKKYTPTQITIAIRKAGLCTEHRQLAYELYMTKEEIRAFHKNSNIHRDTTPLSSVTLNNSIFN
ncbi:MAG: hypothetical protein OQL19_19090 [Gammaproteobacteria bacterium]|nr:hypothetical protein [Gammaproteobacteria bacterium]